MRLHRRLTMDAGAIAIAAIVVRFGDHGSAMTLPLVLASCCFCCCPRIPSAVDVLLTETTWEHNSFFSLASSYFSFLPQSSAFT